MKDRATSLHVAALPFPSPQGTQAAIRFMMEALARTGEPSALLTYPHGEGEASFPHLRAPALVPDRSLRSGPSLAKVVNDLALAGALASHAPSCVVAHHVEAAAIARVMGRPWVFVAHTDLATELPTYFAPSIAPLLRRSGGYVDRSLGRSAGALAAVSPLLASMLAARCARPVHALPIPWPVPPPITPSERERARRAIGLALEAPTVVYAGNLDGYQGLSTLWEALACLRASRPTLHVCVASADPRAAKLEHVTHLPLATEDDRRRAHALADVVLVPRRSPGGLPVKLLDAMARGCTVVTVPRALAGHAIDSVICAQRDDDAPALQRAIEDALAASASRRAALGAEARAHVATQHSDLRFVTALAAARREAQTCVERRVP